MTKGTGKYKPRVDRGRVRGPIARKVCAYLRGQAADGGTISDDVAEDLGMTHKLASAWLAHLTTVGAVVRVGTQRVGSRERTVYVLADELDDWRRYLGEDGEMAA